MALKKKRNKQSGYALKISELNILTGNDMLDLETPFSDKGWNEKQIHQYYKKHENFILSLVGVQHPIHPHILWIEPGNRPPYWWELTAPEELKFEYNGKKHSDRRRLFRLAKFEFLKKHDLLFPGEEKHFYDRILEKFDEKMKIWSYDAAKKYMKIELDFMKRWQEKHPKHAENG